MDRLRPAMLIAALVVDVGRRLPRRCGSSTRPLSHTYYNLQAVERHEQSDEAQGEINGQHAPLLRSRPSYSPRALTACFIGRQPAAMQLYGHVARPPRLLQGAINPDMQRVSGA